MRNKHIGSNFDDFLEEEGMLAQAEAVALKRALAYQIEKAMKTSRLTKLQLSKRMNTSRSSVNRLLDPQNPSITLNTLEKVAVILGKKLEIKFA